MPSNAPCCPVSQEPYEADGPNKPRSLPCGHSISHGALDQILRQRDADRRRCPIDRVLLTETSAAAYPVNYAIVEIIGTLLEEAGPAAAAPPPPRSVNPMLPQPPTGLPGAEHAARDLSFAEVLPGGSPELVSDAVWDRIQAAFSLPRDAVDGTPSDWDILGWTATGHCAYRGFDTSGGGIPRAVALCYVAVHPRGSGPEAARQALRAAVAPHVALQLLPDVRPLLPPLHGLLVAPAAEASTTGPLRVHDTEAWLVYAIQGQCLALHLEQHPQHCLPAKIVVSMWRQLSSAIEAMHRHNLTTATLHPITVASVQLDSVDGPSSVRIAPYAREIPGEQLGYSSTGAFEELCVPPEAGPGGAVADCAAADVWRVAAVATIALTGDTLKTALDSGTQATPAMLLMAVQTLRRDASRMPAELADILEGCLHHNPVRRWTAERMHAALLSESLDSMATTAAAPAPLQALSVSAPIAPPPRPQHIAIPPRPQHIAIALPMEAPPQSNGGQRPTLQTRSLCSLALVRSCYMFAILFVAIIMITTFSSIFG